MNWNPCPNGNPPGKPPFCHPPPFCCSGSSGSSPLSNLAFFSVKRKQNYCTNVDIFDKTEANGDYPLVVLWRIKSSFTVPASMYKRNVSHRDFTA